MVLLQPIVEIVICPMLHAVTEALTYCSWVRSVAVRYHSFWGMTNDEESLLEKSLSGFHIASLAEARINQVAISINGTIEVTPLSVNFDVCLIRIPGPSGLPASFRSQLFCQK
jgi:hypothetical protein